MTIFGLSLLQVFLLVLVVALAVVGAEQIRTHIIQPTLLKARAWLSKTEATVEGEFEKLLGHAKATTAVLPPGSTVTAKTGTSAVEITTPADATQAAVAGAAAQTPLDPIVAAKRYIAGGMNAANGMPTLAELLYLFGLSKVAQVAWAQTAAQTIAGVLTTPFEAVSVGDVGAIRPEAASYLNEIGQGYPIVGSTNWTKA